jgi:hypothetical protein
VLAIEVRKFSELLSPDNRIDVRLYLENGIIIKYAINLCCKISGTQREVYRLDNFHGYLHEHKFWIGNAPIRLEEYGRAPEDIVDDGLDDIRRNFTRYREYYRRKHEKDT